MAYVGEVMRVEDIDANGWETLFTAYRAAGYSLPCSSFRRQMKKFSTLREFLMSLPVDGVYGVDVCEARNWLAIRRRDPAAHVPRAALVPYNVMNQHGKFTRAEVDRLMPQLILNLNRAIGN